jgi:pyruvate/2-oxoglutarate dehydrogenase complex dihydrolipoamide dehydrogenase (E3) component
LRGDKLLVATGRKPRGAGIGLEEAGVKIGERGNVEVDAHLSAGTYTRAYDTRPGFMTLVSDGEYLTGAYALGPEAGEWLQQATLAIRAKVPLAVMADTIQPFPSFSEAFMEAFLELGAQKGVPAGST